MIKTDVHLQDITIFELYKWQTLRRRAALLYEKSWKKIKYSKKGRIASNRIREDTAPRKLW